MPSYIAVVRKEENTDFWIDMPDIPGCIADGETEEAAVANFEKAIVFHLDGHDRFEFPAPRTAEEIRKTDYPADIIATYLVEIERDRTSFRASSKPHWRRFLVDRGGAQGVH